MPPQQRKFRAALDVAFLLLLEAGHEECTETHKALDALGCEFILTDTPLQELQDLVMLGTKPAFTGLAKRVFNKLYSHYGVKTPGLPALQNGYAEIYANVLLEKCFLDGASKNEGLMVAEASLHECEFLITLENSLVSIDSKKLNIALMEKHSHPIQIISPESVLTVLKRLAE